MIRVGIGGWTYAPWRGPFYPEGLKQADELAYASSKLTAIEINGTFYRTQSAASFAKWRDETPEGFMFSVKGHRSVVNKSKLAETKDGVDWFFGSGVLELGDKLGPILWQMAPFKRFHADDLAAFFALLPREIGGRTIHHVIEPRHASFQDAAFVDLCRKAGVTIALADSEKYPSVSDLTGPVVYARLQNASADIPTGYSPEALDDWAGAARGWEAGTPSSDPAPLAAPTAKEQRDVFVFMINGAKEHAPASAMGLIERLQA